MQEENLDIEPEIPDIVCGTFDKEIFYATVFYKGQLFGIKEVGMPQLLGSIEIAVENRNEANDLRRSANND